MPIEKLDQSGDDDDESMEEGEIPQYPPATQASQNLAPKLDHPIGRGIAGRAPPRFASGGRIGPNSNLLGLASREWELAPLVSYIPGAHQFNTQNLTCNPPANSSHRLNTFTVPALETHGNIQNESQPQNQGINQGNMVEDQFSENSHTYQSEINQNDNPLVQHQYASATVSVASRTSMDYQSQPENVANPSSSGTRATGASQSRVSATSNTTPMSIIDPDSLSFGTRATGASQSRLSATSNKTKISIIDPEAAIFGRMSGGATVVSDSSGMHGDDQSCSRSTSTKNSRSGSTISSSNDSFRSEPSSDSRGFHQIPKPQHNVAMPLPGGAIPRQSQGNFAFSRPRPQHPVGTRPAPPPGFGGLPPMPPSTIIPPATNRPSTFYSGQSTPHSFLHCLNASDQPEHSPEPVGGTPLFQHYSPAPTPTPLQQDHYHMQCEGDQDLKRPRLSTPPPPPPPPKQQPHKQPSTTIVPKAALHVVYGKPPRRKVISGDHFHTWHDSGQAHSLKWTCVLVCPISGELFFSVPYPGSSSSCSSLRRQWWFAKKAHAEHGAAARAHDCLVYRDRIAALVPSGTNTNMEERDSISSEPPYLENEAIYDVPDYVPPAIRDAVQNQQNQIRRLSGAYMSS